MKSPVVKRSIVIAGHKTSVSLEDAFWKSLKEIADDRDVTLSDLVSSIDTDRQQGNLSSAIRLFVLDHFRSQTSVVREPAVTRDLIGLRGAASALPSPTSTSRAPAGAAHRPPHPPPDSPPPQPQSPPSARTAESDRTPHSHSQSPPPRC